MFKRIFIPFIFIGFYIISGTIFWGEHIYMLATTLLASLIITFFVSKKSKNKRLDYMLLNIPFFGILLFTCLLGNNFSRGLPYLIFTPLTSLLGLWLDSSLKKLIPLIISIPIFIIAYYFQTNYFSFYHNKNAERAIPFPKLHITDKYGKPLSLSSDKIIVLDFWSTNCGICFKKFPELEKIYLEYKNNSNIEIYAINVPVKSDSFYKTTKILDSIGYNFPKIYAKSAKEINTRLKINSFPHLLIVKNGVIRYDGMFETNKDVLLYNTNDEIKKLLKE